LLDKVFTTGEPFYGYSTLVKLEHNGELKDFYVDFTYTPLREDNETITGVLVLAIDVTQKLLTTKKIEDSEAKFRSLIEAAPAGIGLFVGRDLIVDSPNQTFIDIVGKGPDIAGKPLRDVMPELESQIFLQILDDVYTSGKMFHSYGTQVNIVQHGIMSYNYYNITYTPLFNSDGEVYAILDIAIDVTESILARQATEAAEASLRGAIELAELGTWTLTTETNIVTYSQRMLEWYGFTGEPEELQDVYNIIDEKDRQRVADAIANALLPDSDGIYDEEYVIKNRITGRERVLHAQGKASFDKDGKAYMISGTAQDITTQRKLQMTLENEVKARTIELQAANKELEESNRNLTHSNEELAQYAYVASHDLQEPLRKISMFSNLLKERDIEGTHTTITEKILNASRRMSLLIKDLLEFSRLLNPDVHFIKTDLKEIALAIVNDFELQIEEKGAVINLGHLPVIDAIPLHMNQLFNNLMSNALKFMPAGVQPVISISAEKMTSANASKMMYNANPSSDYFRITVKDNGIGIEDKYVKQIFEVFKRLHGRDEYYGSGIGLAICRRIVTNHNGAITIESEPGRGTAFHILLPENQTKQSF
ncbi:MAG: PAS domain-containing sensor histidine kinase, partial [Flavobacterium sp.]